MAKSFGTYSIAWWQSACNGYLVCVAALLYFLLFFLNICLYASTLFMSDNSSPSDICDDNYDNEDDTASLYFLTC